MTTIRDYACFASGLGAGMALAFLFAPRSGSETRNEIQAKLDQGRQILREGKAAVTETIDRQKEGIGAAIDAGKNAYQEKTAHA